MLLISFSRVDGSALVAVVVCLLCFQLHLSRSPSVLCLRYWVENNNNNKEDFSVTKVNESSSLNRQIAKQPQYEAQVSSGTTNSEDIHTIKDLPALKVQTNVKLNDTILGERDSEGNQTIIEGRGAKFKW